MDSDVHAQSPIDLGFLVLGNCIEEGHFSKVFLSTRRAPSVLKEKGSDNDLQVCAAKLMPLTTPEDTFRMMDEIWAMRMLQCHPHISSILDFFTHHGALDALESDSVVPHACIVMELYQGGTLVDHSMSGMRASHLVDVLRQLSDGLRYIAQHGYIHGDIKQENILIRLDDHARQRLQSSGEDLQRQYRDTVVIGDFGAVARVADLKGMSADRQPRGTVCYTAPEWFRVAVPFEMSSSVHAPMQTRDSDDDMDTSTVKAPSRQTHATVGLAGDVWALGCVLWEAGTGDSLPLGDGPSVVGRVALTWDLDNEATLRTRTMLFDQLSRTLRANSDGSQEQVNGVENSALDAVMDILSMLWQVDPSQRSSAQRVYDVCQRFESSCYFYVDPTNVPALMVTDETSIGSR